MSTPTLTLAEAAVRTRTVRPHRCEVELDLREALDPQQPRFPVEVRWTFTLEPEEGRESTFLDFTGQVHEVEINGRALSAAEITEAFHDDRLRLDGLSASNMVRVRGEALYSRSGEGMHRYTDPTDGQVYLYTQYEPADAHRVMPCFDQPDLRAEWVFRVQAPQGWEIRSNGTPLIMPTREGPWTEFSPTRPLPAYLTAVLAGPYVGVSSSWSSTVPGREQSVPLTVWARASMAEHLDAEEIFTLTRQGLDFFTELFDLPYPFDTYEQAFVPEYNLGAMENPGLVTFTEDYLFPDGATRRQLAGRANTLLHEMAHMWFGDLVAISWWEDLWLKESFAEFMGAHASAEATEFTEAWSTFALRRKAWAYRQDAMVTTHPIVAEVPDVAAAQQNFDGITYAKGAAALKQLVAFVGLEAFTRACRTYFRRHAFGAARLEDFLAVLQEVSERDTARWAEQWLTTVGATMLELATVRDPADGSLRTASLTPRGTSHDPALERDHQLVVSVWEIERDDDEPAAALADASAGEAPAAAASSGPRWSTEITVSGRGAVALPELEGARGVVVVNDRDLDYAEILLDADTRTEVLAHLSAVPDLMARAVLWSGLWSDVRNALLDPREHLEAVHRHLFAETDATVLQTVLEQAAECVEAFVPVAHRPQERDRLLQRVLEQLQQAPAGSDRQKVLAQVFAQIQGRGGSETGVQAALGLLSRDLALPGLEPGPELRWDLLTGLAAAGHPVEAAVTQEAQRDASRISQMGQARTRAAQPAPEAKEAAWAEILGGQLSNDLLTATIQGFRRGGPELTAPYREQYFAMLEDEWSARSMGMAGRLVRGLFPGDSDLQPGARAEDDDVLQRTDAWLQDHPQAPRALRRILLECRDELLRRLTVQAAAQS